MVRSILGDMLAIKPESFFFFFLFLLSCQQAKTLPSYKSILQALFFTAGQIV